VNAFSNRRRIRLGLAGAAAVVTAAALASAGLAGLRALDFGPAAAQQYPKKVTICHRTHSKKHPWVKIRVSTHALKAHLRHGDFVVDANHPCPPTSATAKAKNKHGKHGKNAKHQSKHKSKHNASAQKKKHGQAATKNNGNAGKKGNNGNNSNKGGKK
jgi:hypothetical protein